MKLMYAQIGAKLRQDHMCDFHFRSGYYIIVKEDSEAYWFDRVYLKELSTGNRFPKYWIHDCSGIFFL